ncbi:hypothetical protein [Rubrolithibacter danxiaensis]|uniref:hypothetical protein n=1 Tax=Rubrolithibacter danxiaensis TaxID=3390805 RepID=UPI003BF89D87
MLEAVILFLVSILIFGFQPFTWSMLVPLEVRVFVLFLLIALFISFSFKKRKVFYFLLTFLPLSILLTIIWVLNSPRSIPFILYFFAFTIFTITLLSAAQKVRRLKFVLTKFLLFLVLIQSILAIFSFLTFNFNLLPFSSIKLGDFDYYNFYYNPFLGYIDPKPMSFGTLGRVAGFMFEPSYLAWFLTTNFFFVHKCTSVKGVQVVLIRVIVFLGAMATCSTMCWLVFLIIFFVKLAFGFLNMIGVRKAMANIAVGLLVFSAPIVFFAEGGQERVGSLLGKSSLDDRQARIQESIFVLLTSSSQKLVLGHAPGFVEVTMDKGESNQYIKLFVEEGILVTVLIIGFVVHCTNGSKYFMIANLLFLNSAVVLLTPLFIINIVVCKWQNDKLHKST